MATHARKWRLGIGAVGLLGTLAVLGGVPDWVTPEPVVLAQPPSIEPQGFYNEPYPMPPELVGVNLLAQTDAEKLAKSVGCMECHQGSCDPHYKDSLRIGCTDCHGGDPKQFPPHVVEASIQPRKPGVMRFCPAGPAPRYPEMWKNSANPVRSYALLNHESPDYIRFTNPGDFRIAHISCGTLNCHPKEVYTNRKQIMTTGAMLWGAALYNNGSVPYKRARHGEAYSMNGAPLRVVTVPPPTEEEKEKRGVVPFLDPLPRFEASQPGNVLRIFERGGRFRPETGIPETREEPGRPRTRLSNRGLGTENRTDPVLVSLNKSRLFDPTLNFIGTCDHPGDFRHSGCTACHVVYANDRSSVHSAQFAKHGHMGLTANPDPTIPKDEPGHPIEHRFTNSIPSSQCMICHVHPGTTVMNSYLGYMWYDEDSETKTMYPEKEKFPNAEEFVRNTMFNPDAAAGKGRWSEPDFLINLTDLNPTLKQSYFADFHSHGWVFRAVFKHDRHGNFLDSQGNKLQLTPANMKAAIDRPVLEKEIYKKGLPDDQVEAELAKLDQNCQGVPVHLMDIHMQKGMHCVDCHFVQDMHGNGRLHMEVRAATEIQCVDCHGTAYQRTTLRTTGPASYTSSPEGKGRDLASMRTPYGKKRFEREGDKVYQNSMVEKDLRWEVVQTIDSITPGHVHYNEKSAHAKTVRWDKGTGKMIWGDLPAEGDKVLAHGNSNMHCIACHTSWNPSCYGCHLPQRADLKMPHVHWEGDVTRNYTSYNFQTLRDDVFMLARDGDATGNRIGPSRSSCAIHVGSYNNNRESIYIQQQTISGGGLSGIAFSTNVPHTVRGRGVGEVRQCNDCHVSQENDNNAWMAQLMMQGTNYLNFVGKYCWVAAGGHGLEGIIVTETDEPQAVIGSALHAAAFPNAFEEHVKRGRSLELAHEHPGRDILKGLFKPLQEHKVYMVQNRGEYLFAACGKDGIRAYDIAFIDNKAFAERITTAPVSPMGQKFFLKTCDARAVVSPTTTAPDPTREQFPENKEAAIPLMYAFNYVADYEEGLILCGGIASTIDGNPVNNFLKRELTFNPKGLLDKSVNLAIAGTHLYMCCEKGLVVIDIDNPKEPKVTAVIDHHFIKHPKAVAVQFRYAYVCDEEGIKVLDLTDPAKPVPVAQLKLPEHPYGIYLAREYAYVAAGKMGLVILDIRHPDRPRVDQIFTADGCINDLHDVKLGITYTSQFAYLADGKNGLRVVQLTDPETPGNDGFSTRPQPRLIATRKLPRGGHALAVAKGLDRDRAVDEAGQQISVFGRVGARPFNKDEMKKLYMYNNQLYKVSNDPNHPMYGRVNFRIPENINPDPLLPPTGPVPKDRQAPPPIPLQLPKPGRD